MNNTTQNKQYGITRQEATRIRKNGTHKYTGKNRYRIFSDHKNKDTQVKMCLNNGRYVADGKLEKGWKVTVLNELGGETFKDFKKAKQKFEEISHGTAPTPDFNHEEI